MDRKLKTENRKLIIPGGSGFLGRVLAADLAAHGYEVVILARSQGEPLPGVTWLRWDGETLGEWSRALDGACAVVNLAGKSVNCRYHAANRAAILASRLRSTRVLAEAIRQCDNPPPVWINSSSATIYRDARDRPMDERTGELGKGFSVDVCRQWEAAFFEPKLPATRRVALRTALVLARGGGVLEAFERMVRLGLGGTLGPGDQQVSWVHSADFAAAVRWLIDHPELNGPVNCAAPGPVPNREFMRLFREAYRQPLGLPAAAWMLEIGALLLGTETELLLKSRWVLPRRLQESGFEFRYPDLRAALRNLGDPR